MTALPHPFLRLFDLHTALKAFAVVLQFKIFSSFLSGISDAWEKNFRALLTSCRLARVWATSFARFSRSRPIVFSKSMTMHLRRPRSWIRKSVSSVKLCYSYTYYCFLLRRQTAMKSQCLNKPHRQLHIQIELHLIKFGVQSNRSQIIHSIQRKVQRPYTNRYHLPVQLRLKLFRFRLHQSNDEFFFRKHITTRQKVYPKSKV